LLVHYICAVIITVKSHPVNLSPLKLLRESWATEHLHHSIRDSLGTHTCAVDLGCHPEAAHTTRTRARAIFFGKMLTAFFNVSLIVDGNSRGSVTTETRAVRCILQVYCKDFVWEFILYIVDDRDIESLEFFAFAESQYTTLREVIARCCCGPIFCVITHGYNGAATSDTTYADLDVATVFSYRVH